MQIDKPLLAAKYDPKKAQFPYAATPKIDGIRFLMVNGQAVSRSYKPIRNEYIQDLLSSNLPNGIDGELTCGDNFQESTSAIMRIKGEPNVRVWIFDYVNPDGEMKGYTDRMTELMDLQGVSRFKTYKPFNIPNYQILYPKTVNNQEEVDQLMTLNLEAGFEGLILRDPNGLYKFGRATVKENILLKVKDFEDAEAEVIGFKEKFTNTNTQTKDAFGRAERSTAKDGLVPADTLGGFLLRMSDGREFTCGSGLNDELRHEIWNNQESYLGKLVKYKFMTTGIKDLPRHPVFLGFRDSSDMD